MVSGSLLERLTKRSGASTSKSLAFVAVLAHCSYLSRCVAAAHDASIGTRDPVTRQALVLGLG